MASSNPISALEAAREFASRSAETSDVQIQESPAATAEVVEDANDDIEGFAIKALPSTETDEAKGEVADEAARFAAATTLEEVIDVAGADDTYDFLQSLGDDPTLPVDETDSVFVALEASLLDECARRAEALGVSADAMEDLSEFCRQHPDLKNVLADFGSTRSAVSFEQLVLEFQSAQLVEAAGGSSS